MNPVKFELIVAIVKTGQEEALCLEARKAGALCGPVIQARGTVSNEMLDVLGLENHERAVLHILCREGYAGPVMVKLAAFFQMHKAGGGIVFTLPVMRANGLNALFRLRDEAMKHMTGGVAEHHPEAEEEKMEYAHELIYVVVKSGFADDAMDAAREAGARGGTILHGRGMGIHETARFFGVAIEPEKDILIVLAPCEHVETILHSVNEKVGLTQPGMGVAFSMPVGRVIGAANSLGSAHPVQNAQPGTSG